MKYKAQTKKKNAYSSLLIISELYISPSSKINMKSEIIKKGIFREALQRINKSNEIDDAATNFDRNLSKFA